MHNAVEEKGLHTRVMMRTAYTDVLVIVVSCFLMTNASEIRITFAFFGTGKTFRCISIHELANTLGLKKHMHCYLSLDAILVIVRE